MQFDELKCIYGSTAQSLYVRCVVRFFGRLYRNSAGRLYVWQGISGQYDGKSARRLRAKPSGGLCAGLPYIKKNRRSLPKRRFFVCKSLSPSSSHAHRFRESIMPVPYLSVPAVPAVQKCCCSAPVQWGSSSSSPPLRHPVPFYGTRYG